MTHDDCLRPGDAVLDIGAHDGTTATAYSARVGPAGYVLAIEPHPVSFQALHEAALASAGRLVALQVAVGPRIGQDVLYSDGDDARRSSLWAGNTIAAGPSYPVTMTTVDVLVRSMPRRPRLIKVDAQGAEAGILHGAIETLRLPILWYVELWAEGLRRAGASVADLLWLFTRAGYRPAQGRMVEWQQRADSQQGHASVDVLLIPSID